MNCTPKIAYIFVASNGVLEDREPRRLQLPAVETAQQLQVFSQDTRQSLRELRPDKIAVLRPEYGPHKPATTAVYERAVLETLIRTAAVAQDVEVDLLSRNTVRSKFRPATGTLEEHAADLFAGQSLPLYWSAGRNLAALAALTIS